MRRAQTLLGAPATIYGYEGSWGLVVTETTTTMEKGLGSWAHGEEYSPIAYIQTSIQGIIMREEICIKGREYALLQRMTKDSTTCERKKALETK